MQILVPITGHSQFFPADEFYFPKPLVEVAGQPMIELVIDKLKAAFPGAKFIFVIDREDALHFSLDRVVMLAAGPDAKVVERKSDTSGALCSCLLAIDVLDRNRPLLISNGDQIVAADLFSHCKAFAAQDVGAGVLTFDSVHPRWSYAVVGENGYVAQAVEKRVVSRNAIAGLYWFRTAGRFIDAAQSAILHDAHVDGKFFLSSSINEVILSGENVAFSSIPTRDYHSFYAPQRIDLFERTDVAAERRRSAHSDVSVNVIIPAAGEGSRFAKDGWKKPKPFIDVGGSPMLQHVIANVSPAGARPTLLLRKAHIDAQKEIVADFERNGAAVVPVAKLTEGTACTVLLARTRFDGETPMMVANSDQLVDFDVTDFVRDCLDRDLDGSILVFRDPTMNPKWSFARLDNNGHVTEVAEKKPISDLATVGIYLFRRGREFMGAAAEMIANNDRVNGEFYTCPVYNYMIQNGAKIGVYEVPMNAMHGLGTPEDLRAYLEAHAHGASADAPA